MASTGFEYPDYIECWMFALAGGVALLIGLLTVGVQSSKAASSNPIDALRHE